MTVNTPTLGREAPAARAGGAGARRGDRLPPPPRERRPLLAAFAVLLIVGGATVAGLLALRADTRVPVLVLARDVVTGQKITADLLDVTQVASEGTLLVPASQQDLVVGRYAKQPLSQGQLLDSTMLTDRQTLTDGKVAVGAALAIGRVPATGLKPGDVVQLVHVVGGEGTVLVPDALVSSAVSASDSPGGGTLTATFVIDKAEGARVAGVAAEGQLAVVLVSRGAPLGGED